MEITLAEPRRNCQGSTPRGAHGDMSLVHVSPHEAGMPMDMKMTWRWCRGDTVCHVGLDTYTHTFQFLSLVVWIDHNATSHTFVCAPLLSVVPGIRWKQIFFRVGDKLFCSSVSLHLMPSKNWLWVKPDANSSPTLLQQSKGSNFILYMHERPPHLLKILSKAKRREKGCYQITREQVLNFILAMDTGYNLIRGVCVSDMHTSP